METLRDRIEREERERIQFEHNFVNAGSNVVGLAGSIVDTVDTYRNYKNLKNERDALQKELAERERLSRLKSQEKDQLKMQIALRKREIHQDILCKMIYPITTSTINVLHQQGMTLLLY